ncbi:MAG: oligosaccharide flippase family protein [Candidatus Omnitrophica bacterium]|nr:oligosaccharide flippase family protein [Candidatus Omnitrophota bacterium]
MARSVLIYSVANTAFRFTPIILLPILTRRFSPEEYGIMASFLACLNIAQMVVVMGGANSVIRAYFDRQDDPDRFARFVFNTCLINIGVSLLIALFFLLFGSRVNNALNLSGRIIFLIPVLGLLSVFFSYPQKLAVFERKPLVYSLFSGLYMTFELMASLFFIFCMSMSWQGRIAGILVTRLIAGFGSLWYLKNRGFWRPVFDFTVMKDSFAYGFPVFIHSLGVVLLSSMDRLFLNSYEGPAATGIYSVAVTIVGVTGIVIAAFGFTWTPILFKHLKEAKEKSKKYLVLATYKTGVIMTIGMLFFALLVPFLLKVVAGERYQSANIHLNWLCAGALFNGLYVTVSGYIFYFKKMKLLALISISITIIGVLLYPTLIKLNGPLGAAQANCAIFFIRFLAMLVFGYLVCPMPWLGALTRKQVF